jgi:hypothetical protein
VEEWQTLLAQGTALSGDQQLGLWGELWLISNARDPDRVIAGWRGPDREALDFLLDGLSLELKASRTAHVHYVSQRQVELPAGTYTGCLLSLWVGVDPVRGKSLKELAELLIARASDPPSLLKKLALAGYVPKDSDQYGTRWLVLEAPYWFWAKDVPRVRAADVGVSNLRYRVALDVEKAIPKEQARQLWRHFCGVDSQTDLLANSQ